MAAMAVECGIEAGPYLDHVWPDAEFVGHHLRRRCFVALAGGCRAEHDDHRAVEIELDGRNLGIAGEREVGIDDARLAEVVGAGIERRADADADPAPFGTRRSLLLLPVVPADQLFRLFEQEWIVAGVIYAAVRRGVGELADVVTQEHLVARDTELVGTYVDDAFHEPQLLQPRIDAVG